MHTDAALPDELRSIANSVRALTRESPSDPDLAEETDDVAPAPRPREGLPKNYRSRHDRHYVEQLTSSTSMPLLRMLAVSRIDAAQLPPPADVTALTASVARLGVLQPLLVRAQGDRFVLIAGRKRLVAAREAQCREVPCLVHTADDERAQELAEAANAASGERRERLPHVTGEPAARAECDALTEAVLPEVQHALASVHRSLRLLPQTPGATRERVAMRLIAAELERAQWLVRSRRYLAGRVAFAARPVAIAEIEKEIRAAGSAIALHGGQLDVIANGSTAVAVDAPLLTTAIHGLAWALLALGETAGDARVRVTIESGGHGTVVITMSQPAAVLTQQTLLRFFDAGWKTRPGGPASEVAVQLARYAAASHGADLEVSSGTTAGTAITLTLR
jgi:ParB-like chromosome segregation protein Spo0J